MPTRPRLPASLPLAGPVGKVRSTGTCILLMIVTLGIYGLYWYFATHDEMKRHSGQGIGGGIALLLAIFVGIVMPFLNSNEVGNLYTRRGQKAPVTAVTGLWVLLLGWFFLVGRHCLVRQDQRRAERLLAVARRELEPVSTRPRDRIVAWQGRSSSRPKPWRRCVPTSARRQPAWALACVTRATWRRCRRTCTTTRSCGS